MDELQKRCAAILARDFARTTGATVVSVTFTDDERIIVATSDHFTWYMDIGSDDEEFTFESPAGYVSVPFSPEWIKINEEASRG